MKKYVCVCVCVYICIYISIYIERYTYTHICVLTSRAAARAPAWRLGPDRPEAHVRGDLRYHVIQHNIL